MRRVPVSPSEDDIYETRHHRTTCTSEGDAVGGVLWLPEQAFQRDSNGTCTGPPPKGQSETSLILSRARGQRGSNRLQECSFWMVELLYWWREEYATTSATSAKQPSTFLDFERPKDLKTSFATVADFRHMKADYGTLQPGDIGLVRQGSS